MLVGRIALNVAITLTLVFWYLSSWWVLRADIGSNSVNPRGLAILWSPRGLNVMLLDRAVVTNTVEWVDVTQSPSGWDWDAMQRPFERKWSLTGVSVWYRTRQCPGMFAVTYPAMLAGLVLIRTTWWFRGKRKGVGSLFRSMRFLFAKR